MQTFRSEQRSGEKRHEEQAGDIIPPTSQLVGEKQRQWAKRSARPLAGKVGAAEQTKVLLGHAWRAARNKAEREQRSLPSRWVRRETAGGWADQPRQGINYY